VILGSTSGSLLSFDEFDNFFDDFLSRRWPRLLDFNFPAGFDGGFPKVDILDHDNEIEGQAELPGVKKEEEKGKYFRSEITRGEFQRTVSLPDNVDDANAKASFKDGILTVTLPKTEKSKRKTIEIK
jgi:HSP20 family protein